MIRKSSAVTVGALDSAISGVGTGSGSASRSVREDPLGEEEGLGPRFEFAERFNCEVGELAIGVPVVGNVRGLVRRLFAGGVAARERIISPTDLL